MAALYSANLFRGNLRLSGTTAGAPLIFATVPAGHVWVALSIDIVDIGGGDAGNLFSLATSDLDFVSGGYIFGADPGDLGYSSYRGRLTLPAGVQLGAWDQRGDEWSISVDGYDLTT